MTYKRPFNDDDYPDTFCKYPRKMEYPSQLPRHSIQPEAQGSGESCNSPIPWLFFKHRHQLRALFEADKIFPSVFYHPGVYQDYVPKSDSFIFKSSTDKEDGSNPHCIIEEYLGAEKDDNSDKLIGTCILPMPKPEDSSSTFSENGQTRDDCECIDAGSIRCARQHVREAREKLRLNLGADKFKELGFDDMGEEVAKKWNEDEERIFHEVVFSNPESQNKNFWEHLPVVLPLRTNKEIVSYYYNVFMLRIRSEQNRFDPLNIDSDNDEWQRGESESESDSDSGSGSESEEYEETKVQSPVFEDVPHSFCNLVKDGQKNFDDCGNDDDMGVYSSNCWNIGSFKRHNIDDFNVEADFFSAFENPQDEADHCGVPESGSDIKLCIYKNPQDKADHCGVPESGSDAKL